jgi:signal peptidase I
VIRTVLFQPFNIPSESMEDTLLVGDYLFVSKAAYGFSHYSLPWGYMWPLPHGRIFSAAPHRGDVVVFKTPSDNKTDFIKRVIGLPGDRIQMKYGTLYLNGKAVPKVEVEPFVEDEGGYEHKVPRYRETLPGGVNYYVLDREPDGSLDNTGVFVVPEGHYFMMGDNRDNSDDSRAGVGYVPFENLVGKAEILFFSTNGSARLWEIWKWPFAIRYGRIASFVH